MSNVFCVADYILQKLNGTTAMKLQKLVYYCQAWSLAWDEIPLFTEEFEAWANGPICRSLYAGHRKEYIIKKNHFAGYKDGCDFTEEQIETMDKVLAYYGDKEPHWLSELTHMEEPWKNARAGIAPGESSTNVISKESMREYYSGL